MMGAQAGYYSLIAPFRGKALRIARAVSQAMEVGVRCLPILSLITFFIGLLRQLDQSGRYQHVYTAPSNASGDNVLRGHLYDFREVSGSALMARVAFAFELRDTKTGTTVWSPKYAHDEPVSEKDVSAVVAAMDRNVHRGLDEVADGLERYFSLANARASRMPR